MVATKFPYGAISENYIAYLMPSRKDGKCYIIIKGGSIVEIEPTVYHDLEKKGVQIYEGRFEKAGIKQL